MNTLIGTGFGFPLKSGPRGLFESVTDEDLIAASIATILTTRKGERWMLPNFGGDLWKLIFEPVDSVFESLAYHYIIDALEQNEPRITVVGVSFYYDPSDYNSVFIDIKYRIKATNSTQNRVFPFFRAGSGSAA